MKLPRSDALLVLCLATVSCTTPEPCPPIDAADVGPVPSEAWVDPTTLEYALELRVDFSGMSSLAEGLYCVDQRPGRGDPTEPGTTVSVHYTGYLPDGSVFDSSRERAPFTALLGIGQVVPGWDLGLLGMRVGGERLLVVPPHLAYGMQGTGGVIPPNAVLVFEVELLVMD